MVTDCHCFNHNQAAPAGLQKTEYGFTLVELIVAVAIISILAAIAIPSYAEYINKALVNRTIVEIRLLGTEITAYQVNEGHLPDTLVDIGRGSLTDPWGHPYKYLNIADGGTKGKGKLRRDRFINPLNTDYDLYSMGADGDSKTNLNAKESRDDILRAKDGLFIGLAWDFDPELL
jgi:general secretion pathway protein G